MNKRHFYAKNWKVLVIFVVDMTLHVYNPEHDIALACNQWNFSLPKAAKLTRLRYCHIPAMWAQPGDWILTDTITEDCKRMAVEKQVRFVLPDDIACLKDELPDRIEPWGWDRYIVHQLVSTNKLLQKLCPTDAELQVIREMSSRKFAADNLLPQLVAMDPRLVGKSNTLNSLNSLNLSNCVLKSPWSCSGRGLRFIGENFTDADRKWTENIIREQGYIMQEPKYEKVLDFAMEFRYKEGRVEYQGINVFETRNGQYVRNLGTQELKNLGIDDLLLKVRNKIISTLLSPLHFARRQKPTLHYITSFGVDMMIVEGGKLHPCVELNLRHTMGQKK